MIAATPASSNRLAMSSTVSSDVSAQPSTATLPSRASRPTATRLGNLLRRVLHQRRIAHRRGADDDAVDALLRASPRSSSCRGCRRRAARRVRPSSRMRSTAATFIGLPANAPSRSTTCRCSKPCGLEGMRLRRRIAVEHGGARHVALLQAHAQAVLQIDGGKQDHVTLTRSAIGRLAIAVGQQAHRPRFTASNSGNWRSSASPSFWLFSGWNCVPTMLSRATMAVTGPP